MSGPDTVTTDGLEVVPVDATVPAEGLAVPDEEPAVGEATPDSVDDSADLEIEAVGDAGVDVDDVVVEAEVARLSPAAAVGLDDEATAVAVAMKPVCPVGDNGAPFAPTETPPASTVMSPTP